MDTLDLILWSQKRQRQAAAKGKGGGFSWSSYWTPQIAANIDAQYYWWDNASYGNTRRLRILHALTGGVKGIDYTVTVGSDAHYEISNIQLVDLVFRKVGTLDTFLSANQGINTRIDSVTFSGTSIKMRLNKNTSYGIFRAVLLPGTRTYRGQITLGNQAAINSELQDGYFYTIWQNGDYTTLAAGLTGCVAGDIVAYFGGVWTKYTLAQQTYIDVDTYSAGAVTTLDTIFTGLTLGTYTMGCFALGTKNVSSTGYLCFPTTGSAILSRRYAIYGGVPNAGENPVSLINTGTAHWEMSMKIEKNSTTQTAGWIPEHTSTSGTQLNYHLGEDVAYDANGTAITGYNTGDLNAVACPTFTITNVSYAVNVAAGTEELLKVTTVMVFTKTGINIKNTYEGLVDTLAETIYSYMLPWSTAIFNKFVSDYREEIALPGNGVTTNITDGGGRKDVMVYNDTASGDYENYILAISVPNPTVTNKASALQSFLYNYGTTYGKMYLLAASNDVISVGESYTTEINVLTGRITGLIAMVDTYIGS